MASITGVANTLVSAIAAALYPDGFDVDPPNSIAGMPVKVYAGWPLPEKLDADLLSNVVNISVFPKAGAERITTRYFEQWKISAAPNPTLTMAIDGQNVTIDGTVSIPQVCAAIVDGIGYPYVVLVDDTLETIASGLAAVIAVDLPDVTVDGVVITLPDTSIIDDVRVGAAGTSVKELRRQERQFTATVWAYSPASRDAVANVIDYMFTRAVFLSDDDDLAIKIVYNGSNLIDEKQKIVIYRQDFTLTVEYGTAEKQQQMQIVIPVANVSGSVAQPI